jgi:hypothetical protein
VGIYYLGVQVKVAYLVLEEKVMEQQYKEYDIAPMEEEYIRAALQHVNCKTIDEFMKLDESQLNQSYRLMHLQHVLKERRDAVIARQPKICDCGSKHTSFPNHHYYWCSMRKWEKGSNG